MKITTVILHYWPERVKNIKRIVDDLKGGSIKPKIIVFNNNPKVRIKGAINSNFNYGGRARYAVALLKPSDYYYFIDDDMTIRSKTLENFANHAEKGCCFGYRGKILSKDNSYRSAKNIWANTIDKPKEVDLLVGNGTIFTCKTALLKMFEAEKELGNLGREEDLILSMINKSKVIPAVEDNKYITNLPDGGVGYYKAKNHWDLRERMVKLLKWNTIQT